MNSSIQSEKKTRGLFSELVHPLMPNEIFHPTYLFTALTFFILMNSPVHIDTEGMELSILNFKGLPVKLSVE